MSKEVSTVLCVECESQYKLLYDASKASGHPKFCPFCAGEVYNEDDSTTNIDDD